MKWGYARVSTTDQCPDGQVHEILKAGVEERRIVVEYASGAAKRPKLSAMVRDQLREGDELVVARLDRLGRHARDMHELLDLLRDMGVKLVSLREGLSDSAGPMGAFLANVLIAVSVQERETLRDRQRSGIERARARGVHLGRPYKLSQIEERTALAWRQDGWTVPEIAKSLHCSVATVDRALRRQTKRDL